MFWTKVQTMRLQAILRQYVQMLDGFSLKIFATTSTWIKSGKSGNVPSKCSKSGGSRGFDAKSLASG